MPVIAKMLQPCSFFIVTVFWAAYLFVFSGCREEDPLVQEMTIEISLHHKNMGSNLSPGLPVTDSSGTLLSFSKLQYFLSNIRLESDNPMDVYAEPLSYHLIKALDNGGHTIIRFEKVPLRKYKYLHIGIGLDSLSNRAGSADVPVLQAGSGMYWSWSDEFKFMVLEGNFQKADTSGAFLFHVTGNACYREIRLDLKNSAGGEVAFGPRNTISLLAEIPALFGSPNPVDFREMNNVMSPEGGGLKIAGNYSSGGFLKFQYFSN
jgi:hypothetical protein